MKRYTRKTAKAEAASLGVRYRMTARGQVDFYGRMPNSNIVGWYAVGRHDTGTTMEVKVNAIIRVAAVHRGGYGNGRHSAIFYGYGPFEQVLPLDTLAWEPIGDAPAWLNPPH